jgi:hypothetical protein
MVGSAHVRLSITPKLLLHAVVRGNTPPAFSIREIDIKVSIHYSPSPLSDPFPLRAFHFTLHSPPLT